jgi:bla regulator protein BlaR1
MLEYGAVNAANLDGGSSSVMVYNGEIINNVVSLQGDRTVPTAWLVK